jgi:hypothetical protein
MRCYTVDLRSGLWRSERPSRNSRRNKTRDGTRRTGVQITTRINLEVTSFGSTRRGISSWLALAASSAAGLRSHTRP